MTRRVGSSRSTGRRSTTPRSSRPALEWQCANYLRIHDNRYVPVLDDGGARPWVCFDGRLPESEWQDPVNVSFVGPALTYDQAAAAAGTTTTTTK